MKNQKDYGKTSKMIGETRMNKLTYCDACGKDVEYIVLEKKRKGNIKGTEFSYVEVYCRCKHCGNFVEVPEITEKNLKEYYEAYKKAAGLLSGKDIFQIRSRYGLSASKFAQILCLGEKTITRYENGAIQSREVDLLIRLASKGDNIVELAQIAGIALKKPGLVALHKARFVPIVSAEDCVNAVLIDLSRMKSALHDCGKFDYKPSQKKAIQKEIQYEGTTSCARA